MTHLLPLDPAVTDIWLVLLVLGGLSALLSLDDTTLAQTWFGQPLPAAILTGWLLGDVGAGVAVGLPLQLIVIGNLPVGRSFTGEPTSAAVGTVGGALLAGETPRLDLAQPWIGDWGLVGWLLLAAALLSLLGNWIVAIERRTNTLQMLDGHRTLRDGRLQRIDRLQLRCFFMTALRGFILGILATLLVLRVWLPLYSSLPAGLRQALGWLPLAAPALCLGILLERYNVRARWPWVALGALAAATVKWVAG